MTLPQLMWTVCGMCVLSWVRAASHVILIVSVELRECSSRHVGVEGRKEREARWPKKRVPGARSDLKWVKGGKVKNTMPWPQTHALPRTNKQRKKEAGKSRPCLLYKGRGREKRKGKRSRGEGRARPHPFILFLKYSCPYSCFSPPSIPSHSPTPHALCFELQPTIVTRCLCYAHKKANESRKRNAMRWRSRFHSIPTIGQHECEGGRRGQRKADLNLHQSMA